MRELGQFVRFIFKNLVITSIFTSAPSMTINFYDQKKEITDNFCMKKQVASHKVLTFACIQCPHNHLACTPRCQINKYT